MNTHAFRALLPFSLFICDKGRHSCSLHIIHICQKLFFYFKFIIPPLHLGERFRMPLVHTGQIQNSSPEKQPQISPFSYFLHFIPLQPYQTNFCLYPLESAVHKWVITHHLQPPDAKPEQRRQNNRSRQSILPSFKQLHHNGKAGGKPC